MTGELVTTEMFRDIPVRIIQAEKDRVIPLNDIADGIGYGRDALQKIVRRNPTQFKPYSVAAVTSAPDGKQYITLCLTRDGITGVLMRLHTNKLKDPLRKERVEKFQHWVMDTIGKVMEGKLQTPPDDVMAILRCNMQIARIVSEFSGVNQGIASTVAIAHTEDLTGEDLSWCKALIPGNKSLHTGHLNATEIGERIGMSNRQVNKILEELGYQVRAGKEWKLTVSGLMYGEMMPYTVKVGLSSHSGYRPLWDPEIIGKIQNYRPGLLEGQKGLLAGYLS